MNHLTIINVLLFLMVLLCIFIPVIRTYYYRIVVNRRRKRIGTIVLVNPRPGRNLLLHRKHKSLGRRLGESVIANRHHFVEMTKKLAMAQGIDNSSYHTDTFSMAKRSNDTLYANIYSKIRSTMSGYARRASRRLTKLKTSIALKLVAKLPSTSRTGIIKFIQNTGGVKDAKPNQTTNRSKD